MHSPTPNRPGEPTREPNRSDWAYRKAAEIYALALDPGRLPPTTVMDMIACELRVISYQGHVQGVEELARVQKDWGVES